MLGGVGGGGGQSTLGCMYCSGRGDNITREGTLYPRVYCPGDNIP